MTLRAQIGESPQEGWDCYLVWPAPWWFHGIARAVDACESWVYGCEPMRARVQAVRFALFDWRRRRYGDLWWEYRAV